MEEEAQRASDDWMGGLEGSEASLQWSKDEEALLAAPSGARQEMRRGRSDYRPSLLGRPTRGCKRARRRKRKLSVPPPLGGEHPRTDDDDDDGNVKHPTTTSGERRL